MKNKSNVVDEATKALIDRYGIEVLESTGFDDPEDDTYQAYFVIVNGKELVPYYNSSATTTYFDEYGRALNWGISYVERFIPNARMGVEDDALLDELIEGPSAEAITTMVTGRSGSYMDTYGCTQADMEALVEQQIIFKSKPFGYETLACQIMSDAQEEMALGNVERARQYLNKAKYVLTESMKKFSDVK